jgi:menaquinone-specific isochorismate synthase
MTSSLPDAVPHPLVVRTVPLDGLETLGRARRTGSAAGTTSDDAQPATPDPRDLIDLLPADAPLAWVRRGDGIVAWGEALRIEVGGPTRFADAEAAWRDVLAHAIVRDEVDAPGSGPVAFGSFAFDDDSPAGGVVVVPRVVVGRRGGRAVEYGDGAVPAEPWKDVVARAVAAIRAGEVDKAVLARDVCARTEHPIDVRWPLGRLAERYPSCWTFSVDGMIGATPELLVRSEKGLVTSRVLAGTIRRTGDDAADLARAAILAHSSKDLEEHEYAVASVGHALEPFCSSINVPDVPFVLHLPNVLHLASDVTAVLAGGAQASADHPTSLALAAALHPTAAVCGTPTAAARELIARIEGMDRARYAGPVGWFGGDGDGEWGIALRSAALDPEDPHRIRLFAGCGIVAASDPAAELAESEAKLVPMRDALASTGDPRA